MVRRFATESEIAAEAAKYLGPCVFCGSSRSVRWRPRRARVCCENVKACSARVIARSMRERAEHLERLQSLERL